MISKQAEKLIARIRVLRYCSLILHLLAIMALMWLGFLLVEGLREKYLFYHPFASFLFLCTIAAILLMRALLQFNSYPVRSILQLLDEKYQLLDRLTTYDQLRKSNHPFLPAFISEINTKIQQASPLPLIVRISRLTLPIACLLLMFASLAFLPYLPEPQSITNQKREKARLNAEVKNLQKEILRIQKQKSPETEKLLKEFERAARDLVKPEVKNEDALRKLNDLQMKLDAHNRQLNDKQRQQLAQKLSELARGQISQAEKQQLQELADQTMTGEGKEDPAERAEQIAADQQTSPELQRDLQHAIQKYREEQKQKGQQMAEMQGALENAKKGISPGSHNWTANSRLSERDVEKRKSGVNDGPGTTNQDVGPQNFDTKKYGKSEYVEDRTKAQYEQLYRGEREKAGSDPLYLKSQWDKEGEQKYVEIRNFGLDKKSTAGKDRVATTNQDSEESALREEKVPASYQKIVKKYFESIKQQ